MGSRRLARAFPTIYDNSVTFTGTGNYTIVAESALVVKKATGAATTVTLPSTRSNGQNITIFDGKGDAATNTITVNPAGSDTIDGSSSQTINTNYGVLEFQFNGVEWNVVSNKTASGGGGSSLASLTGTATPFPITGLAGSGSTAGGIVNVTGGAGGATNAAGGATNLTGGVGGGTGNGGASSVVGGASGGGATGNGGAAKLTGGAALSTAGNGGAATITGGVATTTGTGGAVTITGGASAGASGTAGGVTIDAGAVAGGTGATVSIAPTNATGISLGATTTMADATNLVVGSTTGTKIGTATTQKIGFYNQTPVVQPASATGNVHTVTAGSTTNVFVNTTFDGSTGSTAYTVGDVVKNLKAIGLLAA